MSRCAAVFMALAYTTKQSLSTLRLPRPWEGTEILQVEESVFTGLLVLNSNSVRIYDETFAGTINRFGVEPHERS